nr:peptide chain release factor N(5)-glutamine methyltransferase [Oceaniglobus ichthyenteri]
MDGAHYRDLLRAATCALEQAGIDGAPRDARLLLAHSIGVAPGRLTLILGDSVSEQARDNFQGAIQARLARKPVSHILGRKAFWEGEFEVTQDTLAPRPETETLIEHALAKPFSTILDLGTGTGCIAISLLMARPETHATACDISPAALAVAGRNATRHGVQDRLTLVQSDWFSNLTGRFDLIVSNPPYIAAAEMPGLAPEVREFDPDLALTDHGDGLTAYRAITERAMAHLTPEGRLLVEIGATQGAAVQNLFAQAGFGAIRCFPDLDGRDRVVGGFAATTA